MRLWKKSLLLGIAFLGCCALALPQSAPLSVPDGSIIEAKLVRGVDSTKAKVGDAIEAETTWPVQASGAVPIPKGSHLIGRVTSASGPTLGLVFDSVTLPSGLQLTLNASIQGAQAKLETAENRVSYGLDPGPGEIVRVENCDGEPLRCDYIVRRPVERVDIMQGERGEALLRSTRKRVNLPNGAKLIVLVGPLEEVCRTKGYALLKTPDPRFHYQFLSRQLLPAPAKGVPTRPTVVVREHGVLGCTYSADAWIDAAGYKRSTP